MWSGCIAKKKRRSSFDFDEGDVPPSPASWIPRLPFCTGRVRSPGNCAFLVADTHRVGSNPFSIRTLDDAEALARNHSLGAHSLDSFRPGARPTDGPTATFESGKLEGRKGDVDGTADGGDDQDTPMVGHYMRPGQGKSKMVYTTAKGSTYMLAPDLMRMDPELGTALDFQERGTPFEKQVMVRVGDKDKDKDKPNETNNMYYVNVNLVCYAPGNCGDCC